MQNQMIQATYHCKVCEQSGFKDESLTHNTCGPSVPQVETMIRAGYWPILYPLGGGTNCPILATTVCTNPMCFNGQNGVIRYPEYGHSRNYCPCAWPEGWEANGPLAYMKYSGIQWINQGPYPMFFQIPIPNDAVYLEDIELMVWEEIEDEFAKELDFQHKMDDFIEIQEMEETNEIVMEELAQLEISGVKKKKILKIQKKMNQIEKAHKKMVETGSVEENQKHLLEKGLMETLQKQMDDLE